MFECFNYTTEELNNFYQYPSANGLHPTLQAVYENRGNVIIPPSAQTQNDTLMSMLITAYNFKIVDYISQKFINGNMCAVRRSVIPISKRNPTLTNIAQVIQNLWVEFDNTHFEKYMNLAKAFKRTGEPITGDIKETMDSDTTRTPNITTSDKMTGTDTNARTGTDTTALDDTITENGSEEITKTGTDTTTIDDTNTTNTDKTDTNAVTTYEDTVNFSNADRLITDETITTDTDGTHTTAYNTTDGHTTKNTTTTDGTHTTIHNTTDTLTHNTTRTIKESGSDKTATDYTKTISRGFSFAEIVDRESKIQSFVDMYLNDLLQYISLSIIY